MAKYNQKIVNRICDLISKDSYTIAEICEKVKISESTYYEWLKTKSEFSEAIKKAQDKLTQDLLIECNRSLVKLIRGYTIQEKKTVTADTGRKDENDKPIVKVKEHSVVEKYYPPSLGAIIHFQTNRDPDNWKNRQENKLSGEVGIKSNLENLSDEDLQNIIDGKTE
uniref:phBC6A51 family helix-turn-helix protein n=1 Tax=uncultured Dysgonomonas sp. TaxID=206096 RepID=UPI002587911A|nr:phBC6A51 family helix-turn-helix protein [uncultured Dysgonomonas sp.]